MAERPAKKFSLPHPLRMYVVAGSAQGKTYNFLRLAVLPKSSPFSVIVWCTSSGSAGQEQLLLAKDELDARAEEKGLPQGLYIIPAEEGFIEQVDEIIDLVHEFGENSLIVFDDLLNSRSAKHYASTLFISGRHRRASCAWLGQRVFGDTYFQTMRLQSNVFMIGRFEAESEVRRFFQDALADRRESAAVVKKWEVATSEPYGFLLFFPGQRGEYRYRNSSLTRGMK